MAAMTTMCVKCGDSFEAEQISSDGKCVFCEQKDQFAAFAVSVGLSRYPDPSGERYVYRTDGQLDGKKSECMDFMDELWNTIAKIKKRPDLKTN